MSGCFRPGYDPRRHVFTTEERRAGYRSLIDAVNRNGGTPEQVYRLHCVRRYLKARTRRKAWLEISTPF